MARLIDLPTHGDERGKLTVAQEMIPFEIKRVYYIYEAEGLRGGHRHKTTDQALICLNGSCEIYTDNNRSTETFILDDPAKCLIVHQEDWHTMDKFSPGSILLVLASTKYDIEDYIDEPYR